MSTIAFLVLPAPALNAILYGAPAALLLIAAVRSARAAPRASFVYGCVLAGWLAHCAIVQRHAHQLPAALRIEAPDAPPSGPPQIAEVGGRSVLQLQAPATLDWTLQGNERQLHFNYGFIPAAYEQGTTNGGGVTVTLRRAGITRTVFRRTLVPHERAEDRGGQEARIVLPPVAPGEQLSVAFDAGAAGDAAWDWLYLADAGFQRSGSFLPGQFPSFDRLPDIVDAPLSTLFQQHERPFFLHLHAPARFECVLRPNERIARFQYGFLPGAYTGANATDGARFVVELQSASGPVVILLDRLLEPLKRQGDRGPQPAELKLGSGRAGDRLVFRIEPGLAGSNSWDWTYVSRLTLE